ncbi:MAG: hypothetical protein AAGH40_12650, partial [Verrucomicrobiota bacterium]
SSVSSINSVRIWPVTGVPANSKFYSSSPLIEASTITVLRGYSLSPRNGDLKFRPVVNRIEFAHQFTFTFSDERE